MENNKNSNANIKEEKKNNRAHIIAAIIAILLIIAVIVILVINAGDNDVDDSSNAETSVTTTTTTEEPADVTTTTTTTKPEETTPTTTVTTTEDETSSTTTTTTTKKPETTTTTTTKNPETTTTTTTKKPETTTTTTTTKKPVDVPTGEILLDVIPEGQGTNFESGSGIMAASMVLKYYGVDVDLEELYNSMEFVDLNRKDVTPWEYCMGVPRTGTALYYAPVVKNMINTYLNTKGISNLKATDITGCTPNDIYNYVLDGKPVIVVANAFMKSEATNGVSWELPNGETFVWKVDTCYWIVTGVSDKDVTVIAGDFGDIYTVPKIDFEKSFEAYDSQAILIE